MRNPIDWVGLFFLGLGVGCLQIMLDKGKDLDWFESNVIIGLTITALIALTYFVIWNNFQQYKIVDFSFFKNRNFALGTLAITLGFLIYFASAVTIPLWLQTEQNYTPYWAGVAVAPIGLASFVLSTTIGKHMHRLDLRLWVILSFIFFALGFFYQANFTTQVSLWQIILARFYQGFGVAFFFLPLVQLSLGEVHKLRYASAAGLFHFIRILVGSGFGTSLTIEIWTRLEIFHHARLTEALTVYSATTNQFYDYLTNYSTTYTPDVINRILDSQVEQQAFMLSTNDLSWGGAWLFLCLIPLIFLCKPVTHSKEVVAAH